MPSSTGFTRIRPHARRAARGVAGVDGPFWRRRGLGGYEKARANLWHRQLHIFLHPFYYIEYGIAQLGALQVWANSKRDKAKALGDYKKALALGGSRPLPELFAAAGCQFQFDAATIKPLIQLVGSELAKTGVTVFCYGLHPDSTGATPASVQDETQTSPLMKLL